MSAAFGDLEVALLRLLSARLKAAGGEAAPTVAVEAATDQLEAAVREAHLKCDAADETQPAPTGEKRPT